MPLAMASPGIDPVFEALGLRNADLGLPDLGADAMQMGAFGGMPVSPYCGWPAPAWCLYAHAAAAASAAAATAASAGGVGAVPGYGDPASPGGDCRLPPLRNFAEALPAEALANGAALPPLFYGVQPGASSATGSPLATQPPTADGLVLSMLSPPARGGATSAGDTGTGTAAPTTPSAQPVMSWNSSGLFPQLDSQEGDSEGVDHHNPQEAASKNVKRGLLLQTPPARRGMENWAFRADAPEFVPDSTIKEALTPSPLPRCISLRLSEMECLTPVRKVPQQEPAVQVGPVVKLQLEQSLGEDRGCPLFLKHRSELLSHRSCAFKSDRLDKAKGMRYRGLRTMPRPYVQEEAGDSPANGTLRGQGAAAGAELLRLVRGDSFDSAAAAAAVEAAELPVASAGKGGGKGASRSRIRAQAAAARAHQDMLQAAGEARVKQALRGASPAITAAAAGEELCLDVTKQSAGRRRRGGRRGGSDGQR